MSAIKGGPGLGDISVNSGSNETPGSMNLTYIGGAGSTTADGGPGRDLISIVARGAAGTVTVRSFNDAEKISLQGYAAGEEDRALAAAAALGTPANPVLSDGTKVNLSSGTQLDARSFV